VNATVCLTADSPYFAGHFPGRPILPGVVELHLVAQMLASEGRVLRGIRHARLRQLVVPGDRLELSAQAMDGGRVKVTVKRGDTVVANGELVVDAPLARAERAPAVHPHRREGLLDLPPFDDLLPHRPPMRLVTALAHEEAEGLACLASIPAACALVSNGVAPALAATEAAAQAAALWEALRRWRLGAGAAARVGYLVAMRDVTFYAEQIPADTSFLVTIQLQDAAPPLTHYRIEASSEDGLIASGVIATFLTDESVPHAPDAGSATAGG